MDATSSVINSEVYVDRGKRKKNRRDDEEPLIGNGKGGEGDIEGEGGQFTYPSVSYLDVFQFGSSLDKFLFALGLLAAIGQGSLLPLSSIIFGNVIGKFADSDNISTTLDTFGKPMSDDWHDWEQAMITNCEDYAAIGAAACVLSFLQFTLVTIAGLNIIHNLKRRAYNAFLRQNMAWYDSQQSGQLQNRLIEDLEKVRLGVSDKVALSVQNLSTFVTGIILGFYYSWKMALVVCSVLPLLAMAAASTSYFTSGMQKKEQEVYAVAAGIAEETISSMRTVTAFSKQSYHLAKYADRLKISKRMGIKKALMFGISLGCLMFFLFSSYALAFYYGPKLIADGELSVQHMMTSFFSIMMGAMSVGNAFPGVNDIMMCRGAAAFLIAVVNRKPEIDSFDEGGIKPSELKGKIAFNNVKFAYPTRRNMLILKGVTFTVNQGETVALVGHSGCGKSTTVSLVQRFYNPDAGEVTLDDVPVSDYNIQWLRQQIGVVSQEPILFGYSIAENISFGKPGVTRDQIEEAAKKANAHSFITGFSEGYDTEVGERGAQLSGGQKQRIAIARALVRDPSILLLDEATSALDTESEKVVQDALDKASAGRTTIVIAHRLSTIKNATKIIAFEKGRIVEQGTHSQLMDLDGTYAGLVKRQNLKTLEDDEGDEKAGTVKLQKQKSLKGSNRFSRFSHGSTSEIDQEVGEEGETEKLPGFGALMRLNKPEWYFILMACIAAVASSGAMPVFAVFLGEMTKTLGEPKDEMLHDSHLWSLMFLVLGIVIGTGFIVQLGMLSLSGEKLTERLRFQVFKSILSQDIEFFDSAQNSTGALTAKLAQDASIIQGATGIRLKSVVEGLVGMLVGLFIAFYFGWQLALLILAIVPVIAIFGALHAKSSAGFQLKDNANTETGGKIVIESLSNIRTVHSLGLEKRFQSDYQALVDPLHKKNFRMAFISGLANGFTNSIFFFIYAAGFRMSTWLIIKGKMKQEDSFKVLFSLMFASMGVGSSSAYLADFAKAQIAADRVFKQLETQPVINNDEQSTRSAKGAKGHVEFEFIKFAYPERRKHTILRGLSLTIRPGQKCALVGYSGCGKSTLIQLLLRFYDPDSGSVLLDGTDIRQFSLESLRSVMAIVSQEPILFQGTIFENIAYGLDDPSTATQTMVAEVARKANVAEFVNNLPDKYQTQVGDKGTQLSGGQKQRIAIARALIRQPKILLLDEATSALDTESERIVQEALDQAQEGRTCLIIAHRLSTIQQCDQIVVVDEGKVREIGTHTELLHLNGIYAKLCNQQSLGKN